jgi:methylated-DNA-[protein]-cysteine S-methyltransferase
MAQPVLGIHSRVLGLSMTAFTLFDTAIGTCGIAWTDSGIRAVQLPEGSAATTRARLLHRNAGAELAEPPADVHAVIKAIEALLQGEAIDLTTVPLDDTGVPEFNRYVYNITRAIPLGSTRTYGSIASELGDPQLAQQVGQVLGRNPFPIIVPCHRVLAANGKLGGFSAPGGVETKRRMLLIERALPDEPLSLFS